jgi:hypothetical protein
MQYYVLKFQQCHVVLCVRSFRKLHQFLLQQFLATKALLYIPQNLNTKIQHQLMMTHRSEETAAYYNMDDILFSIEHNMMLPHAGRYYTHIFTHEYLKQKHTFQTELDLHREITEK